MDFQAHIAAFCPVYQGQHGFHLFILLAGNPAHIGLINQLGQGYVPRKLEIRSLRSRQRVSEALGAAVAAALAEALGGIHRFVDRGDHLTDRDGIRRQTEAITAARPRTLLTRPCLRRRANNCSR